MPAATRGVAADVDPRIWNESPVAGGLVLTTIKSRTVNRPTGTPCHAHSTSANGRRCHFARAALRRTPITDYWHSPRSDGVDHLLSSSELEARGVRLARKVVRSHLSPVTHVATPQQHVYVVTISEGTMVGGLSPGRQGVDRQHLPPPSRRLHAVKRQAADVSLQIQAAS